MKKRGRRKSLNSTAVGRFNKKILKKNWQIQYPQKVQPNQGQILKNIHTRGYMRM